MVKFLTRPGCHLCDQARPVVFAEVGRIGGVIEEVDIDSDDELVAEYGVRIPVVLDHAGNVLDEGIIDRNTLRDALGKV